MQASLSLVTRQTAAAQGDFARTSNQSANQSRIFTPASTTSANVGAKLLPVFSKLVKGVNGFVDGMENGTGAGGKFADVMRGVATAARAPTQIQRPSALVQGARDRHDRARRPTEALAAGFGAYRIIGGIITLVKAADRAASAQHRDGREPDRPHVAAIAGLAAGLVLLYKRSETARRIIDGAFSFRSRAPRSPSPTPTSA
jgi:hypothetical protein